MTLVKQTHLISSCKTNNHFPWKFQKNPHRGGLGKEKQFKELLIHIFQNKFHHPITLRQRRDSSESPATSLKREAVPKTKPTKENPFARKNSSQVGTQTIIPAIVSHDNHQSTSPQPHPYTIIFINQTNKHPLSKTDWIRNKEICTIQKLTDQMKTYNSQIGSYKTSSHQWWVIKEVTNQRNQIDKQIKDQKTYLGYRRKIKINTPSSFPQYNFIVRMNPVVASLHRLPLAGRPQVHRRNCWRKQNKSSTNKVDRRGNLTWELIRIS